MIIHRGSHTYTIADGDLIVRGDSFYAQIDTDVRGQTFRQYVKVTPPIRSLFDSGLVYNKPELPPRSIVVYVAPPLILENTPNLVGMYWQLSVNRADPQLVAMYERHYSCYQYKDGRKRKQGVAPGQYIALMTVNRDALFIWTKQKYRADKQTGVNCAVFRNESAILSSTLIQEAVDIAQRRWPGERLFTFVDANKIASKNPGYCFKKAGWKACGFTATGLLIFEWLRPTLMTVQLPADLLAGVDTKLSLGVKVEAVA